jgi:hypothetical protein
MTFKLVNGVPQAFDGDGQTARMGKDGVSPMTLAEWVDALVSDAPHLFEANAGGGAAGSGSGGAGNRSVKNPFRKESFNLTEQMKIQKSDPQLAARLKAAAISRRRRKRVKKENLNYGKDTIGRHHRSGAVRAVRLAAHGGEIRPVSIRHRGPQRRTMTSAPRGRHAGQHAALE